MAEKLENKDIKSTPVLQKQEFESLIEIIFKKEPSEAMKDFLKSQDTILVPSRTFVSRFKIRVEPYQPDEAAPEGSNAQPKYFIYQDDLNDETYLVDDFSIKKEYRAQLVKIIEAIKAHIFPSEKDPDYGHFMHYEKIICYEEKPEKADSQPETILHICLLAKLDNARMYTNKYSNLIASKINPYEINVMLVQIKNILKRLNNYMFKDVKIGDNKSYLFPISPIISPRCIYSFEAYEFKVSAFFCYLDDYKEVYTRKVSEELSRIIKPDLKDKEREREKEKEKDDRYGACLNFWIKGLAYIAAKPFLGSDVKSLENTNDESIEKSLKNKKEKFDRLFSADYDILIDNFLCMISNEEKKVIDYVLPSNEFQNIKDYLFLNFLIENKLAYKEKIRTEFVKLGNQGENIPTDTDPFDHIKNLKAIIEDASKKSFKLKEGKEKDNISLTIELKEKDKMDFKEGGDKDKERNSILVEILPFWNKQFIDFKCTSQFIGLETQYLDDLHAFFNTVSEEFEYINAEIDTPKDQPAKAVFRSAMIIQVYDDIASSIIFSMDMLLLMTIFICRKLHQQINSEKFGWIAKQSSHLIMEARGWIRQYKAFWNENAEKEVLKSSKIAF